jgi:transposase-like protein
MDTPAKQTERRRRSPAEVAAVVAAFEQSGQNRTEYCRQHGLSLSTLNRHRQGASEGRRITPRLVSQALPAASLIPVDVVDGTHKEKKRVIATPTPCGLIGCRKQVLNFSTGKEANQSAGLPFIWNGEDLLNSERLGGFEEGGVAKE